MFKPIKVLDDKFQVLGEFKGVSRHYLVEKEFHITEYLNEKKAIIFLGEKEKFTKSKAKKAFEKIMEYIKNRNIVFNPYSFINDNLNLRYLVSRILDAYLYTYGDLYTAKTKKIEAKPDIEVFIKEEDYDDQINKSIQKANVLAKAVNFARKFQAMPPNICNSEFLAKEIESIIKETAPKVSVEILNKQKITDLGMNLLLAVNKGSVYEPRVVVLEYKGNPNSTEKTVFVGKGITFDSGGYNLKPGRYMNGMKYDMSGAIICAAAMQALSNLNSKGNFSAVLPITDNRVNGDAGLPDAIWKSMNGKTVEVNNTDAEGRLILADGLTYAIRNLKATRLIDIATLTGAIKVALGITYSGVWATSDKAWDDMLLASKKQEENIWRMPFHEEFAENIRKSEFADLLNTDYSGNGGSNSAAMFLKEFTEDVEYIHIDIAGTAESGDKPKGVMVKTLTELALLEK